MNGDARADVNLGDPKVIVYRLLDRAVLSSRQQEYAGSNIFGPQPPKPGRLPERSTEAITNLHFGSSRKDVTVSTVTWVPQPHSFKPQPSNTEGSGKLFQI